MTEAEWMACTDPTPMLEFLRGRLSDRQSRLLMFHFAHELLAWHHDTATREVITILERFAEGSASGEGLHDALRPFVASCPVLADDGYPWSVQDAARPLHAHVESAALWLIRRFIPPEMTVSNLTDLTGLRLSPEDADMLKYFRWLVCKTLRDVVGTAPFRPVALDPSWRTEAVVGLAEGIYQDRAYDRMSVLADALEHAGCSHEDILSHCRGDGPHVRGCWVMDLLTGRK
jgi:hypothetical protein